jgi:hypothetical protein
LNPILQSMFLDLRGLSEIEAEQLVFDKYVELYLGPWGAATNDGSS